MAQWPAALVAVAVCQSHPWLHTQSCQPESTRSSCSLQGSANWLLTWAPGIPHHRGQEHCYTTAACTVTAAGTWLHSCAAQLQALTASSWSTPVAAPPVIQQSKSERDQLSALNLSCSHLHIQAHNNAHSYPCTLQSYLVAEEVEQVSSADWWITHSVFLRLTISSFNPNQWIDHRLTSQVFHILP